MKVFTVQEANSLLPEIVPVLKQVRDRYAAVANFRASSHAAAGSAELGGGGMEGGTVYVQMLCDLGEFTTKLNEMGIQLKDYARGLIDFPTMRDGRVVLLCWELGEPEQINWWHEVEDGFAGRRPL